MPSYEVRWGKPRQRRFHTSDGPKANRRRLNALERLEKARPRVVAQKERIQKEIAILKGRVWK